MLALRCAAAAAMVLAAGSCCASSSALLRIPLENYDQMQFFGSIGVGSPPQRFQVIFDTGSSDIWLPETQCVDCAGSRRYNAAVSRSHESLGEPFRLEYGSGNASGSIIRERISLFGGDAGDSDGETLALARVHMGSASATTKRLQKFQADGIVGLGLEALALVTKPSLLKTDPRLRRFSFYINPLPGALPPAQLIFGGVDESLPVAHLPQANRTNVVWQHFPVLRYPSSRRAYGFWAIKLHQLAVGGPELRMDAAGSKRPGEGVVVAVSAAVAIVDSGTSLILLPRRVFDKTMAEIRQHLHTQHNRELRANPHSVSGFSCADCTPDMFPALRFSFVVEEASVGEVAKTQTLVLQGTDYARCDDFICAPQLDAHALFSQKKHRNKQPVPSSAVTTNALEPQAQEEVVVLGVTFLRSYYAQFDSEHKTVGFACVEPSPSRGGSVCSGGWVPPLQFHSTSFAESEASAWPYGWAFWSRVYLSLGLLLLIAAFALLWLILAVPSCDIEKVLDWLCGPSNKSGRQQPQQQQQRVELKASVLERGLTMDCDEDEALEEPEPGPLSPRVAGGTARRKSMCYDV
ncbi:hypothetical protein PHYBOEH_004951 [Phytophthora boehmeriae]|uniref:Peptidase A1 domain-containing protein n=1 Tax=Phytophthora boehmeriae TaxID=109152 RepID=A0A8T1WS94_9STRA|nr:hypothetical protein PHYBOEH_004951 [Phytophthora boehmeriae]